MTHILITTHSSLLFDPLSFTRSLKYLINRSISAEFQVIIFESITLERIVTLFKTYENDDSKLPLIVWLLSHLALKDINGNAIIECNQIVSLLGSFLGSNNQLLVDKTLWLLNNLSLLDKAYILTSTVGAVVNCMRSGYRNSNIDQLITCCDILLNLCHKDSCLSYLESQNEFVSAKGLETLLEISIGMDGNIDALNIVSSLLEIISAYQEEWRRRIMKVGMMGMIVRISRDKKSEVRVAREQAMKALFNLSFLAGHRDFDARLIKTECLDLLLDSILNPFDDHTLKISVSIIANLLVSEIIRKEVNKKKLAESISIIARRVTEEHIIMMPSLIAAIANASLDDDCKEELRQYNIEDELNRFSQKCHPSFRTIIFAAQDNMKLEGNKSPPAYMDLNGNSIGFVGKLMDKRSSLAPSGRRELKPRPVPKNSIAEILSAAIPRRQPSRFLSGIVENADEWKD